MISCEGLQAVCGVRADRIVTIYPFLCAALETYHADTPLRIAMFVAQAAHETAGFRYLEEIASGEAYEGRRDLGNTQRGDGKRYKGRGVFQLTGRANYARCSKALFENESVLLDAPWLLADPEAAATSAGWYWDWKQLNIPADAKNVLAVTKKINGGTNGLAERQRLYGRALYVLGVRS